MNFVVFQCFALLDRVTVFEMSVFAGLSCKCFSTFRTHQVDFMLVLALLHRITYFFVFFHMIFATKCFVTLGACVLLLDAVTPLSWNKIYKGVIFGFLWSCFTNRFMHT